MHIKGAAADFAYADGNGNWTTALTAADMAWGTIVSGIAAVGATWIVTKFG